MALDSSTLADLIDTKYAALDSEYDGWDGRANLKDKFLTAIAQAVVEHLTSDAEITVTIDSITTSTPNATSGGDTLSGSGTGTATGTLT